MTETDQNLVDALKAFALAYPDHEDVAKVEKAAEEIERLAGLYYQDINNWDTRRLFVTAFDNGTRVLKRASRTIPA